MGVDVVAIQAQPRFQAQRVARAQPDGLDFRLRQQGPGQCFGLRAGDGDFETVFTGVAAARQEYIDRLFSGLHRETAAAHEHQLFDARRQTLQGGDGLRPLQCQQRLLGAGDDLAACADFILDMGDVTRLAGAVDDDEQVAPMKVVAVEKHQVIDDAAFVIEQQAVALLADGQVDHVNRNQGFEGGR